LDWLVLSTCSEIDVDLQLARDKHRKLAGILVDENESVGERDLGLHLFTTSGFLDTSFFNRTYWMYSQTWTGFNHANLAPKSGQLLVIGPEQTYALQKAIC
jgi:hypothetical protein